MYINKTRIQATLSGFCPIHSMGIGGNPQKPHTKNTVDILHVRNSQAEIM